VIERDRRLAVDGGGPAWLETSPAPTFPSAIRSPPRLAHFQGQHVFGIAPVFAIKLDHDPRTRSPSKLVVSHSDCKSWPEGVGRRCRDRGRGEAIRQAESGFKPQGKGASSN